MCKTDTQSPVKRERISLKLGIYDLAARCSLAVSTIQKTEKGALQQIHPNVLAFFASRGIDPAELEQEYQEYRRSLQAS